MSSKSPIISMVLLLTASFIWGIAYIPTRYLGTQGVSPFLELLIRYTIPFLIFGIIYFKDIIRTSLHTIKNSFITGSVLFIAITCSIYGIRLIEYGSTGLLLLSLNVILVPLYFVLIKKQQIPLILIGASFLSFIGTLILTIGSPASPLNIGTILCLLASIGYTAYIILCSKLLSENTGPGILHFFQSIAFVILCLPLVLSDYQSLATIPWDNAILYQAFIFIGFFAGTLGYQFYFYGQKSVSPTTTALILSSQIIFSTLADLILFKIELNTIQIIAYICITLAVFISPLQNLSKN